MQLVLAIHRWFPWGGLQRDLAATAATARAAGHRVVVACQRFEGPRPEGLEVAVLGARGWTNHSRAHSFAERLTTFVAEERPDRVLGFDKLPGLHLYFAGDPCTRTRIAARRGRLAGLLPRDRALVALEREVFAPGSPTRVLALTRGRIDEYAAAWETPRERFELLPLGVAPDRRAGPDDGAHRRRVRAEFGVGSEPLLLCLGSDFRRKGFDRAVEALPRLEGARLLVVGHDAPGRLERLARRRGVGERVTVTGARADVGALLQAADVLVHPARTEAAGMVLIEALAAGLPAVASGACGYAEQVRAAGAGAVLEEPFEPQALVAAIARVLSRPRAHWRARALCWATDAELDGLHARVVEALEVWPEPLPPPAAAPRVDPA